MSGSLLREGAEQQPMPAVFIDKDGTLVDDVPFNTDPARIRLASAAASALRLLREQGYRLFVVSNQPGIARGLLSEAQLHRAFAHILCLLSPDTGPAHPLLDGFYYCPHSPPSTADQHHNLTSACCCRKPAPGLLLRAAREHHLQLTKSWMIGDILDDIEAGHRAGCRSVLINNGNETLWQPGRLRTPDGIVSGLYEAAQMIVQTAAAERAHLHDA